MRVFFKLGLPSCIAVSVSLLAGCGSKSACRKVEKAILSQLPEIIGPADSYTVSADCGLSDLMSSRLDGLHIEGENVMVDGKYFVDELLVKMTDVRFDLNTRALKSVQSTEVEAVVCESSLLRYITQQHPEVKPTEVILNEGSVTIKAAPELMSLSARVEVVGKLRLQGNRMVCFSPEKMSVGGLPVPDALAETVVKRFNPVLDFSASRLPLKLTDIRMMPGRILLVGTSDLTHGVPAAANH